MEQTAEQPTDASSRRTLPLPAFTQEPATGEGAASAPAQVVPVVAQADGVLVASLSKDSTSSQLIAPPEGSKVGGFTASVPPGALAVDMAVTMEAGAPLASSVALDALGVLGDAGGVQSAGETVVIAADNVTLTQAMTVSLDLPGEEGAALTQGGLATLVVFYRGDFGAGMVEGLLIRTDLAIEGRKLSFQWQRFGKQLAFQAALLQKPVTASPKEVVTVAAVQTAKAATAEKTPAVALVESVGVEGRKAAFVVSVSGLDRVERCVGTVDADGVVPWDHVVSGIEPGANWIVEAAGDEAVELKARAECRGRDGRSTGVGAWSKAVAIAEAATAAAASTDTTTDTETSSSTAMPAGSSTSTSSSTSTQTATETQVLTPPSQPVFNAFSPTSPSSSTTVLLTGAADAVATEVAVYADDSCTNEIARGAAALFTGAGLSVNVTANATTTLSARAFNGTVASACAVLGAYVHDSLTPTIIASGAPAGVSNTVTATVTLSGDQVTHYTWKVASGTSSVCTSATGYDQAQPVAIATPISLSVSGLGDGSVTLCVVGRDAAGNWQPFASATSQSWTKDTVAPVASLSGAPGSVSSLGVLDISVSGSGVTHYVSKVVAGSSSACSSGAGYGDINAAIPVATKISTSIAAVADGTVTVCVIGRDVAGNWQGYAGATSLSWTKDTVAPGTPTLTGAPSGTNRDLVTDVTVSGAGITSYQYLLQAGGSASCDTTGYQAVASLSTHIQQNLSSYGSSALTLCVIGCDLAGNCTAKASAASATWTRDVAPPDAPTAPTATAGDGSVMLTWTAPGTGASVYAVVLILPPGNGATTPVDGTSYSGGETLDANHEIGCVTVSTGCTVASLTNGVIYRFKVYASDAVGNWSSASTEKAEAPGALKWTWMAGSNSTTELASASGPGLRWSGAAWVSSSNHVYVFGGYGKSDTSSLGALSDLWRYDGSSWTLLKGNYDNSHADAPTTGTRGVAGSGVTPGDLTDVAYATTGSNLWLFGGIGGNGRMNTLWKFDGTDWTWMRGTITVGAPGDASNADPTLRTPSARARATMVADDSNNLWMFGGESGASSYYNDLWKFNGSSWSLESGTNNSVNVTGVYTGTGSTPKPGARVNAVLWADSTGKIWLFGGYGVGAAGQTSFDALNDLWRFDPGTGYWQFMGGSQGHTGAKDPSTTTQPAGRKQAGAWRDAAGRLWMYGGFVFGTSVSRPTDAIWMYDPNLSTWKWVAGSEATTHTPANYGAMGVESPSNTPGGREYMGFAGTTADRSYVLFYGGETWVSPNSTGYADLWKLRQ